MTHPIMLAGDIGGTNARLALVDPSAPPGAPPYRDDQSLQCADYESPEAAIAAYLAKHGLTKADAICLAVAGPVVHSKVSLTNNHWQIDLGRLADRFAATQVSLLNDFEAIAYGLPLLSKADCLPIGELPQPCLQGRDCTVGVVGPGTGLGAGGLLLRGGQRHPLTTEAGHLGFAPESDRQQALWQALRQRFGRVSDERLVSGTGLVNIYTALAAETAQPRAAPQPKAPAQATAQQASPAQAAAPLPNAAPPTAAQIFNTAETDPIAKEAIHLFFEILGQVAGNFALAIGAYDGIYIAGGIVQRYPAQLQASPFRQGFENKGRHRPLLEATPTTLINHPNPGLLGAAWRASNQ